HATQRLQALLGRRNRLLERGRQQGLAFDTVSALAAAIAGDERAAFERRFTQAQKGIAQLRHESWVHWIISHRCYNHYSELVDLIAQGGQTAPTYDKRLASTAAASGAVLDATI